MKTFPATNELDTIFERLNNDKHFRKALARELHFWFFVKYLWRHMSYPFAPFHREIFRLTEQKDHPLAVVVAFRNSGKTTIGSLSLPIWSIVSERKRFVLIVSKTEQQVRQILYNIRAEFEGNLDLIADFGPFNTGDTWNEQSIVIPGYNARITGISAEQSLRGLKHLEQRPDLIIIDDVEDLDSVRSYETREKRYRWFKSEVLPAGSDDCFIFIVGNILHEESLISRLKEEIEKKEIKGIYREFPIVRNDVPLWPARFSNLAAIEDLKLKIGDNRAFRSEYLLEVTSEYDQVVRREWIRRYVKLPEEDPSIVPEKLILFMTATGVDPAISLANHADYTAMVTARIYLAGNVNDCGNNFYVFIMPGLVNERLTVTQIVGKAKYLEELTYPIRNEGSHHFFVEDAGQQKAIIEPMLDSGLVVTGVKTEGLDKEARLMLAADHMERGRVFFPTKGTEDLEDQLLNFGHMRHDDLADAFSTLIRQARKEVDGRVWFRFI